MNNENAKPAPTRGHMLQMLFEKMGQYSILSKLITARAPLKATSKETGIESRADFIEAARERDRIGESAADAFDVLVAQSIVKFFAKPSQARTAVARMIRQVLAFDREPSGDDLAARRIAREVLASPIVQGDTIGDAPDRVPLVAPHLPPGADATPIARVELVGSDRSQEGPPHMREYAREYFRKPREPLCSGCADPVGDRHLPDCMYYVPPASPAPPPDVTDPDRERIQGSDDLPRWGSGPRDDT